MIYDSTRVRIEGWLVSSRMTTTNQTLEVQAGSWRFVARTEFEELPGPTLPPIGSRVALVGVYAAQGGNPVLDGNVAPFDLLLHSPADIQVLSKPSWWTLPRLLVAVGLLVCALVTFCLVDHPASSAGRRAHGRTRQPDSQPPARGASAGDGTGTRPHRAGPAR